MPNSRHARIMRIAMVPRLATSSFLNIVPAVSDDLQNHEWLPVFDRLAVIHQYLYHAAAGVRLYLVHHLHRLDDAQRLALADVAALLDEWIGFEIGRAHV